MNRSGSGLKSWKAKRMWDNMSRILFYENHIVDTGLFQKKPGIITGMVCE